MCGFVGLLAPAIDEAAFARALASIAHRGPDGEGRFAHAGPEGELRLGHRRLAILDLSPAGAQPMADASGRWTLVYNGEIYNHLALRAELEAQGHRFRSSSDTEVLVELLAREGPACLARLDGIFAFLAHDRVSGRLLLGRDHLGVKPLYWCRLPSGGFAAASEAKALFALGLRPRLRRELLGEYLAQLWVQEPDTMFEGVWKLPAGHFAWVQGGAPPQAEAFWRLDPDRVGALAGEAPEALLEELGRRVDEAVAAQLLSDVPVGAYVSGGLDSTLILEAAARRQKHLVAVSSRFAPEDAAWEGLEDDGPWADRVMARHPGLRTHRLVLRPSDYESYRKMVWHLDEPIADPAIAPSYLLAKAAREAGAIVMLSGMGGDEIFGGYRRYGMLGRLRQAQGLPGPARRLLLAASLVAQRAPMGKLRRYGALGERFMKAAEAPWPTAYAQTFGHLAFEEVDALVGSAWRQGLLAKHQATLAGWEGQSPLAQAQRLDLAGFLASHNLIYADKTSMAAGVEARVPLMSAGLTEFALALPDALRTRPGEEKVLLKRLGARWTEPAIAYRPKAGFAMPIRSWLRGPLQPELEALTRGSARLHALLPPSALRAMAEEHLAGRRERSWPLFILLNLELWLEAFDVAC